MTAPALSALLRLHRLHAALETRATAALGAVHGLSLNDLALLMNLARAEGGRMRRVDLAAALNMSQSSVTRMTAPMEKIGLVARDSDPRDARVGLVGLTEVGRTRAAEAEASLARLAGEVFADRWTEDEIATLAGLLGRLTSGLPGHVK